MKGTGTTGVSVWGGKKAPPRRVALYIFVTLVFAFLVLPNFIVIPLSVTDSIFLQFPPEGFTWRWYEDYFGVEGASHFGATGRWIPATLTSLQLGIATMVASTLLGSLAAYGLNRGRFPGKTVINALLISPIIVPILVTAIALFFFLSKGLWFISLRSFFNPVPMPNLPMGLEWLVIILMLFLGASSLFLILYPRVSKRPLPVKVQDFKERLGLWVPFILFITTFYLLLMWGSGVSDKLPGGLFTPGNPMPKIPGVSLGLWVAHIVYTTPFVLVIIGATIRGVDVTLDRAAAISGAGPIKTIVRVIWPVMIPGVAAAAFFSFLISFDELLIALFLSTSQVSTLPKEIWDGIRTEISPTIAAISTMLVLLTVILLSAMVVLQIQLKKRTGVTS